MKNRLGLKIDTIDIKTPVTTLARRIQRISREHLADSVILLDANLKTVLVYEYGMIPLFTLPEHAYEVRGQWSQRDAQDYLDAKASGEWDYLDRLYSAREYAEAYGK